MKRMTFKTKPEHTTWRNIEAMWEEGGRIELLDRGCSNGRVGGW